MRENYAISALALKWIPATNFIILLLQFCFEEWFVYSEAKTITNVKESRQRGRESKRESSTQSDLSMLIESRARLEFVTLLSYRCTWCLVYTCYNIIYIHTYNIFMCIWCLGMWCNRVCLGLCLSWRSRVMFTFVLIVNWYCWWPLDE